MITKVLRLLPVRPLALGIPLGRPRLARCEGRGCPDRSSPVFVVGALLLCGTCRDYRNHLTQQTLHRMRAQALQEGRLA